MTPVKIALMQINASFAGQSYLPYSIGWLQAYTQKFAKNPERYEFQMPVFNRMPAERAVSQVVGADIFAVSSYAWNIRLSLEIAKRVKQQNPKGLITFGGPQVPDHPEAFLRENSFIDIVCHGEGEAVFLDILENAHARDWSRIPAVSYLQKDGSFVQHPKVERRKDLTELPSPYLAGIFERLIQAYPEEQWIALWETNRGCPFSCTFCDWGSAVQSKVYTFAIDTLYREMDWFAEHRIHYVTCCDANFGILPRDLDIASYMIQTKKKFGYPNTLSIQSTKNATERSYQVQKIISDAGLNNGVTISMQSLDPVTLKNIKRDNISLESYQELQRRFTRNDVQTYTDLIVALPGESYDSFFNGAAKAIENGQHNRIKFNFLAILPNAEMGDQKYREKFGMQTVQIRNINIHGTVTETDDEIQEMQDVVIATASMPGEAWCKTSVLSWMISLLHFDKLFQIPAIVLREVFNISYRELFEVFMEQDLDRFPVLQGIRSFFWDKARDFQNGGEEYCMSPEWLNIWWPVDEYMLIKLSVEGQLEDFYKETEQLFSEFLKERGVADASNLLKDSILLNKSLLNQPFQTEELELELSHNVWEFYQATRRGLRNPLEKQATRYHIDRSASSCHSWEDWFREVVWYGSKRGAYFYKNVVSAVPQS